MLEEEIASKGLVVESLVHFLLLPEGLLFSLIEKMMASDIAKGLQWAEGQQSSRHPFSWLAVRGEQMLVVWLAKLVKSP